MKPVVILFLGTLLLLCSSGLFRIANAGDSIVIVNASDYSVMKHFGDFNLDFVVNETDALILQQNFGTHNSVADSNNDGTVDIFDALAVSSNYGQNFLWLNGIEVNPYS